MTTNQHYNVHINDRNNEFNLLFLRKFGFVYESSYLLN